MRSVQLYPILPFPPFLHFFPHSFSLRRPRSCPHFFFSSTCLPSFLFSRPPEPNTCVSSEFQERGPGCRRKQPVTSSLPLGRYLTQPACLPLLWRARATPEIEFLEGAFAAHSLYLGSWGLSYLFSTVHTHSNTAGWTQLHTQTQKHIVLLANLFTSVGCLVVVSRDNPLTATRWPALTHQCNDLAANHRLCNIHEWKQGWMVE